MENGFGFFGGGYSVTKRRGLPPNALRTAGFTFDAPCPLRAQGIPDAYRNVLRGDVKNDCLPALWATSWNRVSPISTFEAEDIRIDLASRFGNDRPGQLLASTIRATRFTISV